MLKNIHILWIYLIIIICCHFLNLSFFVSAIISLVLTVMLNAFWVFNIKYSLFVKSICKIKTNEKIVFLTFDDGPSELYTLQILNTLKHNNINATFFSIGYNAQNNEDLLKQIDANGHIIGNHTNSHKVDFTYSSETKVNNEIEWCSSRIEKIIGKKPKYFRPPYGVTNPNIADSLKKQELKSIGWSIRSLDTKAKEKSKLIERITKRLHPGAIILLHDNRKITSDILQELIDNIQKKGYRIEPLENYI
jgi:peptidoglycan-N-acetylglucosamine deacetylase